MRVLTTKWFSRFARQERLKGASLLEAVRRAEDGSIDADLGGGLIKQRVARQGKGRSGGYRLIVAYRSKELAIFLFGFPKSARENIEPDELLTLRDIATSWFEASLEDIEKAIRDEVLQEVLVEN